MTGNEDLLAQIETIEDFQNAALPRIKEWYRDDFDADGDRPPLDRPPHQLLVEDGADYVAFAAGDLSNRVAERTLGDPAHGARTILLAVGTELTLKGLALKEDTDWFINHIENTGGRAPRFTTIRNRFYNYLPSNLTESQCQRLWWVLELIRVRRNNLVHFAFHRQSFGTHLPAIFEVLRCLISVASEAELAVVEHLHDRETELRAQNPGRSIPPVEFDV